MKLKCTLASGKQYFHRFWNLTRKQMESIDMITDTEQTMNIGMANFNQIGKVGSRRVSLLHQP